MTLTDDHLFELLHYHPHLIGTLECESSWFLPQLVLTEISARPNRIIVINKNNLHPPLHTPGLFRILLTRPLCDSPHPCWPQIVSSHEKWIHASLQVHSHCALMSSIWNQTCVLVCICLCFDSELPHCCLIWCKFKSAAINSTLYICQCINCSWSLVEKSCTLLHLIRLSQHRG